MRRALPFVFAAALAGCAYHAGQNLMPGVPQYVGQAPDAVTKVTVKITVATKSAAVVAHERFPHYFSASSKGLLVQAYLHGKTKVLAQAAVDISPGSIACGKKKTTPRTCSATLILAPSKGDDFVVTDYNAKPVSAKIPKSAKLLGYGKLTNKKISTIAKRDAFSVYLGGVVAGLSGNAGFLSLPGDGAAHSVAVVIHPADFGNNPITAGKSDPFANPIAVTVAESGGTGHMLLSLNGGTGATSVTAKYSTDAVELQYDGKGSIGYGATVTLTAAKVKSTGGARESMVVGPLLLGSTSTDVSPGALALKGNGDYAKINVGEQNAPAGMVFTVATQHCSAIESTMPMIQTAASAGSFAVIARGVPATPNPAGCGIVVADGTSNLDVSVSNTYVGVWSNVQIFETPTPTQSSEPIEIQVGPDGNMWFAECYTNKIGRIQPTGVNPQATEFPLPVPGGTASPEAVGIAAGPDGNIWWTDYSNNSRVGSMTTAGVAVAYAITAPAGSPTPQPSNIATGSDGALWFSECAGYQVGRITTAGTPNGYPTTTQGTYPNITLGPDGNMWFTEKDSSKVGYITPSGAITEIATPKSNAGPWDITAGPDGAMWFTECYGNTGNGAIGRVPIGATSTSQINEFFTGMSGVNPTDITTGPDGALWYTYFKPGVTAATTLYQKNGIGRIDPTTKTITEYPIVTTSAEPWGITTGPDGAIWFTENASAKIARVTLSSSKPLVWPHVAIHAGPHHAHHRIKRQRGHS